MKRARYSSLRLKFSENHSVGKIMVKVTVNSLLMNIHDFLINDFCETISAIIKV